MKKTTASCSCGQLNLVYKGEITKTSVCHCYECQKRTGSAFGFNTRIDRNKVSVIGISKKFVRTGDEGGRIEFSFCPNCGSTMLWEIEGITDSFIVALGCFANQDIPSPTFSVYEDRKHRWVDLSQPGVEHMA